jgi:PAS domain S-box-containing protein
MHKDDARFSILFKLCHLLVFGAIVFGTSGGTYVLIRNVSSEVLVAVLGLLFSVVLALGLAAYYYFQIKRNEKAEVLQQGGGFDSKYRIAAVEATKDAIFIADKYLNILYVNPALVEVWGYEMPSDLVGKPLSILYNAEQFEIITGQGVRRLNGQSIRHWDCNVIALKKDREDFYQHLSLTISADGGFVGVVRNEDEMLQYIALANERLSAIEMAADGVAIVDEFGNLTYMNQALMEFHEIEEYEIDRYLGHPWLNLYSAKVQEDILNTAMPDIEVKGSWGGEMSLIRSDGEEIVAEMSFSRLRSGGMIGSARDVSKRKKMEAEREFLQKQVFQSQKMEAIGRLAGGIAHDFNNILASMLGYTSFLVDDLDDSSPQHSFAVQIMKGGVQAQQLVEQILTFSRKNDGQRSIVSLSEAVDEVDSILQSTIPPSVKLWTQLENAQYFVEANTAQIAQTLMNLCVNAIDAMDEQGQLVIKVEDYPYSIVPQDRIAEKIVNENKFYSPVITTEDEGRRVLVKSGSFLNDIDYVCVSVQDTGSGFNKIIAQNMFDPFFTTKSVDEGTGLGLSTVQGIIITHNGVLEVVSQRDVGTCFKLYFPKCEGKADTVSKLEDGLDDVQGAHILVVDDQQTVRDMLSHMLSRMGYRYTLCEDGDEAIDMLRENPYEYHLVLTDYAMPGLSGIDMAKIISEDFSDMPVVLMSGHGQRKLDEILDGVDCIACALTKPISRKKLSKTLHRLLVEKMKSLGTTKAVHVLSDMDAL